MMLDAVEDAWDVIVVGAGPAGSAAALSCARRSLRVLLVDAKRFPRRKVCGGCLNQVSLKLLQQLLGPDHKLWDAAIPLNHFELSHSGRKFEFDMPTGQAVERSAMDLALVETAEAEGVKFLSPVTARLSTVAGTARQVQLEQGEHIKLTSARVVILANGLGNRRALESAGEGATELRQQPSRSSRLGVETIFQDFPSEYSVGTLHMVVGRDGYVGLTQIAGKRLHVAAALDRPALQSQGPGSLVAAILQEAGAPALPNEEHAAWRGTPPLTARASRLASQRVFLVGDAAGYIEPFTGEGIRWALESGTAVAGFASQACVAWEDTLIQQWEAWYRQTIGRQQRLCQQISSGLKRSSVRFLAHQIIRVRPQLAATVIARLNSESLS